MSEHGTCARYVDGCRCDLCKRARADYEQERQARRKEGTWQPFVDPTEARSHVEALIAAGIGTRQIEARASLSRTTLAGLRSGKFKTMRQATAQAILAIPLDPENEAGGSAVIDATKTKRRFHALVALGYPQEWILEATGIQWFHDDEQIVRASVARKIKNLTDEIGDTPGPSAAARKYAKRRGWRVPAWYDDDFELPDHDVAKPVTEEARFIVAEASQIARRERLERIRKLHAAGETTLAIARQLGLHARQVQRDLATLRSQGVVEHTERSREAAEKTA
jgi:hypothetical protein